MRKLNLLLLIGIFATFLGSCKDEETNSSTGILTDSDKAKLYDKVWYPVTAGTGLEHEFLADGTLRLSLSLEGRWSWQHNGDTMNCVNHQNQLFNLLFTSISGNSMSFKTSQDGYSSTYNYKDTE